MRAILVTAVLVFTFAAFTSVASAQRPPDAFRHGSTADGIRHGSLDQGIRHGSLNQGIRHGSVGDGFRMGARALRRHAR